MPKTRRRFRTDRARERLRSFLEQKCLICLDAPSEHPSRMLPCCRKYIREECLLECLRYAEGAVRDSCPHCRALLTPYHFSASNIPLGPNRFCFYRVHYPPPPPPPPDPYWWLELQGLTLDGFEEDDDPFSRHVMPPPPAGWSTFRNHFR